MTTSNKIELKQIDDTSQIKFCAYLSGNVTNVTGDATAYTVAFDSEVYDIGSNFNVGTYTFTAPINGDYMFSVLLDMSDYTALHVLTSIKIVANSIDHVLSFQNFAPTASSTVNVVTVSKPIRLAATQTAYVVVAVSGSTKVIDITGGSADKSSFSGYLISTY